MLLINRKASLNLVSILLLDFISGSNTSQQGIGIKCLDLYYN